MAAIVTGDRYLEALERFVERRAGPLLDGSLTLKLNPVGLHYVQSRLEALRELEGLRAGAPVDYLRAYVSDLGDHRALEQLRRILDLITSLKVISVLPSTARDPTPLSILPFGQLRVLELWGCDLSASAARGLLELRGTLETLICYNSTDALRHVFTSRIADIKNSSVWNRLTYISCAFNGLVLMDESLQLLPVVETLDLSQNRFAKVDNLRKCAKLRHLDLGFNHLRTLAPLSEASCPIVKLVLRNNALTSLRGIENLKFIEGLDLSYNMISSFSELEVITSLLSLRSLWLEGNPICCARLYRAHVFSFFTHPENLKLDEKCINSREYWQRHFILVSRRRQPAGCGFYFPARYDTQDGSLNKKQIIMKHSRLACIEKEEQLGHLCSDSADQESGSFDSDTPKKYGINDLESEANDLMIMAEYLKKERSVLWLREFKDWMDYATDECSFKEIDTSCSCEGPAQTSKGKNFEGETSSYRSEYALASEGRNGSKNLDVADSFDDDIVDKNMNAIRNISQNNGTPLSGHDSESNNLSNLHGVLAVQAGEPQNLSHLAPNGSAVHHVPKFEEVNQIKFSTQTSSLSGIDETMESCSSSVYHGTPPHYRKDILHRRLNLEEFMQLASESLCAVSSDNDTSSSDDDSSTYSICISENISLIQKYDVLDCQNSGCFPLDNISNGGHEKACFVNNGAQVPLCGSQAHTCSPLKSGEVISTCDLPGNVSSDNADEVLFDNCGSMDQQKRKRKPIRRVISLAGHFMTDNIQSSSLNLNGNKLPVESGISFEEQQACSENYVGDSNSKPVLTSLPMEVLESPSHFVPSSLWSAILGMPDNQAYGSINEFFHSRVADSGASETCQKLVCCHSIFQLGFVSQEREVAVLLSSKNMFYVLLADSNPDGRGISMEVLGCHHLEDIKEVVVGLGLQAVRIKVAGDVNYLLIMDSIENSRELLHLFQVCNSTALNCGYSMLSWEQVQIDLLKKNLHDIPRMNVFLYAILLFRSDRYDGESWLLRSIFVMDTNILVCVEDLRLFSSSMDSVKSSSPYYCFDSCSPIKNIQEVVIEGADRRETTLYLGSEDSVSPCLGDSIGPGGSSEGKKSNKRPSFIWNLRWHSEEMSMKFVSLIVAIHAGSGASPLPVKCIY